MIKSLISEFFATFEMNYLYIILLYAFQFITCKIVSFVFSATFASNWQLNIICRCVFGG